MSADSKAVTFHERRHNTKLRALYPEANAYLQRIFRRSPVWIGTSIDFLALRTIHEHWGNLTSLEVRTLAKASARNRCLPEGASRLVA